MSYVLFGSYIFPEGAAVSMTGCGAVAAGAGNAVLVGTGYPGAAPRTIRRSFFP